MKIIQSTNFNYPMILPQSKNCKNINLNNQSDSFVRNKSGATPNFKANPQNIYKKILEDPSLSKQFMGLVSAAAASLIAAANFGTPIESDDNMLKFLQTLLKNKPKEVSELPDGVVNFEFPKKRGRLSANQQALKSATTNLSLSQEDAEKLTFICKEALKKDCLSDDLFSDLLEEIQNNENKSEVINNFFAKLNLEEISEKSKVVETEDVKNVSMADNEVLSQNDAEQEVKKTPLFRDFNPLFIFKCYTKNGGINLSLDKLLNLYQRKVYAKYKIASKETDEILTRPRWKYNRTVPAKLNGNDVTYEIEKMNSSMGTHISHYANIGKIEPEDVAGAINNEPRYHEFFTTHGALRLIDRYVDFDSDESVEKQSKKIVDGLFNLLERSFQNGVGILSYEDLNFYSPRIIIPSSSFDIEAMKIFGDDDLVVCFAELQNGSSYVPGTNKKAVISTVFSRNKSGKL